MTICCRIGHWVRWETPPARKKQGDWRRRDNIERFPGESRGPSLGGRSGGSMGPGFRRESGLGMVSYLWVGGAGGGLTRNNAVRDGATTLNASLAKAGVHPSAAGAADRWVGASAGKAVWAWFHTLWVGGAGGGLGSSGGAHRAEQRVMETLHSIAAAGRRG